MTRWPFVLVATVGLALSASQAQAVPLSTLVAGADPLDIDVVGITNLLG